MTLSDEYPHVYEDAWGPALSFNYVFGIIWLY